MNSKLLAIIVAVIVCVAGASVALLTFDNNDNTSDVEKTGRLMIFGNANNDDTIDEKDIDLIDNIISTGIWNKAENPYADADNSSKVDEDDVTFVHSMIDKTASSIYYLDVDGNVNSVVYPVNYFITLGTYAANAAIELNLCDKVVGRNSSKSWSESDFWKGIEDKPELGGGSTGVDIGLVSKLENKDAIFTKSGGLENEADFETAGIDVVRLDFNSIDQISSILMMGYMTQAEERAHELANFYDDILDKATELSDKHADSLATALVVYMAVYVYSDVGSHGSIAESAGIKDVWQYDSATDTSNYLKVTTGSEWIRNDEWRSADVIIGQEKWLYADDVDVDSVWDSYKSYYSSVSAFPEKTILINESMALPIQVAYLLEFLYPDDVEVGYGDTMHQKFIDSFIDDLSGNYDVTQHGSFCYTSADFD